ncbi:hypothetical protein C8R47DRAFT_1198281 [Mycena vitilis]|nr:hypothetical protein C8R47DRAFT_1198281 [Mycena vitilis]
MLLLDARGMCHTMSLVASRFNVWTKPITFHTVIVRPHDNWVQRVRDHLLPNGNFIRILVLDLPFREGLWTRVQPSAEEPWRLLPAEDIGTKPRIRDICSRPSSSSGARTAAGQGGNARTSPRRGALLDRRGEVD